MKLSTILITLLLVAGFATGFAGFYGAMFTEYNQNASIVSSSTLNVTGQIYEKTESMYEEIEQSSNQTVNSGASVITGPMNLIYGAYNAGMLVLKTPTLFNAIISDVLTSAKVPLWAQTMIYAIISIIVLFAIIEFLTGRATE